MRQSNRIRWLHGVPAARTTFSANLEADPVLAGLETNTRFLAKLGAGYLKLLIFGLGPQLFLFELGLK